MINKTNKLKLTIAATAIGACFASGQSNPLGVPVDITLWGGVTSFDGPGVSNSVSGLRMAEIAFMPNGAWRYWARYDNTLTLDNFQLRDLGDTGEAYLFGASYFVPNQYQMLLEGGIRHLQGDLDQTIVRGEYVTFGHEGTALKVGGWVGPREDDKTEWMAYVGYRFPFTNQIAIEPTFFYSRTGFGNEDQWRILLAGDYQVQSNLKLSGGIAFGKALTPTGTDRYIGGHLMAEIPMSPNNRAYLLLKRETAGDESLWTVAAGITIGLR